MVKTQAAFLTSVSAFADLPDQPTGDQGVNRIERIPIKQTEQTLWFKECYLRKLRFTASLRRGRAGTDDDDLLPHKLGKLKTMKNGRPIFGRTA